MKVLVTGGSGFIGSHVVDKLVDKGIKVRIYDLVYPEFLDEMPPEKRALVEYYQGSLLEEEKVRFASGTVDAVYHLAAVADVNDVVKDPKYAHQINTQGTFNILESVRQSAKIKRVIYASTVWMYQDTPQGSGILKEGAAMALPSHMYTATKFACEAYCNAYAQLYNIPVTILRFGVPYGPRARGSIVSAIFVRKALNGESITIAGDGSQYRKFVYVEDLAEGCVLALKDIAKNKVYNLEGEEKVSIKQIAETVKELIGGIDVIHTEARKSDYAGKDISNALAKEELGWSPKTQFKEGMKKYIEWYRAQQQPETIISFD